jgi:hypothetical protein
VAGLFGLLWRLREQPVASDIWLAANVGEEGLGNLRGMLAVVERFKDQPKAYTILRAWRWAQFIRGPGAALPFQRTPRAWVILENQMPFTSWRGGHLPGGAAGLTDQRAWIRAQLQCGVMHGGSSVNTIAAEAWLS